MKFYYETERLILRDLREEDLQGMYDLDSNPLVHQFLGNKPIHSIEQAEAYIGIVKKQYKDHGIGRWATIEKSSGNFIGWSGLKFITSVENNRSHFYDVGYRLMPKFWGKGYATEACEASLKYAFEILNLNEVIGTCHEENKASKHVLEKCGLSFKENYIYNNELPCLWLSISREEYYAL
jgi:ribosomal-protein-alanine N-acetyltransferase